MESYFVPVLQKLGYDHSVMPQVQQEFTRAGPLTIPPNPMPAPGTVLYVLESRRSVCSHTGKNGLDRFSHSTFRGMCREEFLIKAFCIRTSGPLCPRSIFRKFLGNKVGLQTFTNSNKTNSFSFGKHKEKYFVHFSKKTSKKSGGLRTEKVLNQKNRPNN